MCCRCNMNPCPRLDSALRWASITRGSPDREHPNPRGLYGDKEPPAAQNKKGPAGTVPAWGSGV